MGVQSSPRMQVMVTSCSAFLISCDLGNTALGDVADLWAHGAAATKGVRMQ